MGCGSSAGKKSKYEDPAIEPAALGRRASRELGADGRATGSSSGDVGPGRKSRPSLVDFKQVVEVVERAGEETPAPDGEGAAVETLELDGAAKKKPERQITTFARAGAEEDEDEDEDEEEEKAEEKVEEKAAETAEDKAEAAPPPKAGIVVSEPPPGEKGGVDFDQQVMSIRQTEVDRNIKLAAPVDEGVQADPTLGVKRLSKTRERVPTCHFKKGAPGFNMDDLMDSSDEEVEYSDDGTQRNTLLDSAEAEPEADA